MRWPLSARVLLSPSAVRFSNDSRLGTSPPSARYSLTKFQPSTGTHVSTAKPPYSR